MRHTAAPHWGSRRTQAARGGVTWAGIRRRCHRSGERSVYFAMQTPIFFSNDYVAAEYAFETTRKAHDVNVSLLDEPVDGFVLRAPTPATREELLLVHDAEYVDAVLTGEPRHLAESQGFRWDPGLATAVCSSTGGARDAVLAALGGQTGAGSLSSGLHHARDGSGAGYCTFNGLVVAAIAAKSAGAQRVAILDFDAHCGGGTASLILGRSGIEQHDVSVSAYDTYSETPNARLVMSGGDRYLEDIDEMLATISDPGSIDVAIYNAGMDPHEQAGGVAGITTEMLAEREDRVFLWAARHNVPMAWVLAGGYTHGMSLGELAGLHRLTAEAAKRHLLD